MASEVDVVVIIEGGVGDMEIEEVEEGHTCPMRRILQIWATLR